MKKTLLALAALLLCCLMTGGLADVKTQGTATVSAEPDMLVINADANLTRGSVAEAQNVAAEMMSNVTARLGEMGIAQEDIVTSYYSVYPAMDYSSEPAEIVGYTIDHSFNVTCRDVTLLDAVISTLTDCGIDHIYGVNFESSKRVELYHQALTMAVADAREKAEVLTAASGLKLGGVENVEELANYDTYGAAARDAAYSMKEEAAGTGIRSGSISVSASVSVEFETK